MTLEIECVLFLECVLLLECACVCLRVRAFMTLEMRERAKHLKRVRELNPNPARACVHLCARESFPDVKETCYRGKRDLL
jgi:hypothetical protein